MVRILDISPLVSSRIGVWPGDVPYRREVGLAIASGANIDLSAIHTTLHLGAHVDAPSHYAAAGESIEKRPLDLYMGPCEVVEVSLPRNARIRPSDLTSWPEAPRVLFKTSSFPDPNVFSTDFVSLSPGLVEALADRGVVLVGLDTPSVDAFADKKLESHQALFRRGLANLEGLDLSAVSPGPYTLIALPLRLEGADASPVRAVLVT